MSHQTEASNLAGYDALLIVGFGGPEGRDDVMPFLENVTRGRGVPRERLLEVAEHYNHYDGVSPINGQVRSLIAALEPELKAHGVTLPVYWGNRNWHPMLADTVEQMTNDGIKKALAVVLAAYSSYSSCRQYREDVQKAREGGGPDAPEFDKMRVYYNHPAWVEVNAERVRGALEKFPIDRRDHVHVAFTAHSIPGSMASNCNYEMQLNECCRLVAESLGIPDTRWRLVYQSRSGRPQDPWLGPDILDHIDAIKGHGIGELIIHPIGFLSDHMEVLYDLDEEAAQKCRELGVAMIRSGTAGTDPKFIGLLRELIVERMGQHPQRRATGRYPANHDVCPVNCCLPPARPARPAAAGASNDG